MKETHLVTQNIISYLVSCKIFSKICQKTFVGYIYFACQFEVSTVYMIFSSLVLKQAIHHQLQKKNIFLTGYEKNVLKLVKKYQVAVVICTYKTKEIKL
jgi:predicted DNA-binding protein YlxM (UPF0122 family)